MHGVLYKYSEFTGKHGKINILLIIILKISDVSVTTIAIVRITKYALNWVKIQKKKLVRHSSKVILHFF